MEKEQYLECGKIINTHGVRGACKIESWCDSPKVLAAQKRVFSLFLCGGKDLSVKGLNEKGDEGKVLGLLALELPLYVPKPVREIDLTACRNVRDKTDVAPIGMVGWQYGNRFRG